jgi:Skp family chaperone for outer membrane proteins
MTFTTKLTALAALVAALALPSLANAQKIGAANVQQIFSDIKETKELETKLKAKGEELNRSGGELQTKVNALKAQRDLFAAGSTEYARANTELGRTVVQATAETQYAQQELIREQKRQTKMIYDKIVSAVAALASEKKYDIVLAQIVPPQPSEDQFDRLTAEQLINLLRQQNILYIAPGADITAEVIARMDAAYAGGTR